MSKLELARIGQVGYFGSKLLSRTTFAKRRKRRKAERKWRSSKLEFDLAVFKRKRNAVNNLLNKARREFYTNFIEENSVNQRRLFRASKRLLNVSRDDGLPPNLHAPTFVNDLGQYFVTR